jgi:hypothetical protein
VKAILIPADLAKDSEEIDGPDFASLLRIADIDLMEIVRTPQMHNHLQVVMVVDDDGHRRGLPFNQRGHAVSAYPGDIVGNVLIMREVWADDGMDLVSVLDGDYHRIVVQGELDQLVRTMVSETTTPTEPPPV